MRVLMRGAGARLTRDGGGAGGAIFALSPTSRILAAGTTRLQPPATAALRRR